MDPSRIDKSWSSAACSRGFSGPDDSAATTAQQLKSAKQCSSVGTRSPANQSPPGSVAGLVQSSFGSVARPARVLLAGQPISDRYAENSVILLKAVR